MTTLVSSYINCYRTPFENATHSLRLARMKPLLTLGVPLCIFVTPECLEILHQYIVSQCPQFETYIKLIVLKTSFFESSYMYITASALQPKKLPHSRFLPKDTFDFLCYSHCKVEFLKQVADINPFRSNYFAWVDYDLVNMFKDTTVSLQFLKMISNTYRYSTIVPATEHAPSTKVSIENQVYIPGCWGENVSKDYVDSIHWRFCGCFMILRIEAIYHLWSLYDKHFPHFLKTYDTMVWDINFLAWLENNQYWKPIWYKADHNDSIIRIPPYVYSDTLSLFATNTSIYDYPSLDVFTPSSASLCEYFTDIENNSKTKIRVLNTRYVNYEYLPSGHCTIHDPNRNVYTQNMCCFLDEEYQVIASKGYHVMKENEDDMGIQKVNDHQMFHGIEDIRLFTNPVTNNLHFIATTVNYSETGQNCMLFGDYDTSKFALSNCIRVQAPADYRGREKNWVPFQSVKEPSRLFFIYKWRETFQIGECVEFVEPSKPSHKLIITHQCKIRNPIFQYYDIRGSSNFVYTKHGYIGLVHFSVDGTLPKHYCHMLVLLDSNTYLPKFHSRIFHFFECGVEFCLTMAIVKKEYRFWISRKDKNPICLHIPCEAILCHQVMDITVM